jgi:hypothetical protein
MAAKRRTLTRKARFEIFKRDGFACQYCGAHPPTVVLEIDHIQPVALGGSCDHYNLVTSCFNCNRGKGAAPLNSVMPTLKERAAEAAEAEAQIAAYHDAIMAASRRTEDEAWQVAEMMRPGCSRHGFNRTWLSRIKFFLGRIGLSEVLDAMDTATWKKPQRTYTTFRYFCGVCWNKIKGVEHG